MVGGGAEAQAVTQGWAQPCRLPEQPAQAAASGLSSSTTVAQWAFQHAAWRLQPLLPCPIWPRDHAVGMAGVSPPPARWLLVMDKLPR